MKYLIAGLGNPGRKYDNTRHNIGFKILDAFAEASNIVFKDRREGYIARYEYEGNTFILLKPTTYMNLSGIAVRYWLKKENIPIENLLVINDDLALPFGSLRIRGKGGCAGHNGLRNIEENLGTKNYARLRFGTGSDFNYGDQVDFVLSHWSKEEKDIISKQLDKCIQIILSFGTIGLSQTMNKFNKHK